MALSYAREAPEATTSDGPAAEPPPAAIPKYSLLDMEQRLQLDSEGSSWHSWPQAAPDTNGSPAATARRSVLEWCRAGLQEYLAHEEAHPRRKPPKVFFWGVEPKSPQNKNVHEKGRVHVFEFGNYFFSTTPCVYQTYERGTLNVNWGCESQTTQTTARFIARAHSVSASTGVPRS